RGAGEGSSDAPWPTDVRRLLGIAQSAADRTRPRPLVTSSGEYVVLLWPHDPTGREVNPQAAAESVRQAARRGLDGMNVSVAVSPRCTELRDYAAGFRVARGAVELARLRGGSGRTITLPDLGVYGLLLQLEDPNELIGFAERVLAPLREYEARKGISLISTLRTYLDEGLSTARTAAALYLHVNTVALRLKRIEELIGMPLTQPEALLQLTAALMAQDVVDVT
ncbi:PucR family transcriptional regulator, partial [Pseudonocardia bannensis]